MASVASQPFASLDPDLPSIAARAAVEVDALMNARDIGHSNLARLADVMMRAFEDGPALAGHPSRFLDPVATDVMLKTLKDARPEQLNSYDALRTASLDLAQRLRATAAPNNAHTLTDLKTFCLALSKHALATSYSREDSLGIKTYKR